MTANADLAILRRALELVRAQLRSTRYTMVSTEKAGRRAGFSPEDFGTTLALNEQAWAALEHLALREIDGEQANISDKARPF